MAGAARGEGGSLNCPICGDETYVLRTEGADRRRRCAGCGKRFTTTELVLDDHRRLELAKAIIAQAGAQLEAIGFGPLTATTAAADRVPAGPGIVYVIQQDTTLVVKIGYTANRETLLSRLAMLQTASPYPLKMVHAIAGTVLTERELHARFSADRLSGEWFRFSDALAAWIKGGA